MANNPFVKAMTRMRLPAGMSPSMYVGGYELTADEDHCVEVPKEHVVTLQAHGLTVEPAKAAPAPQGKVGVVSGNGR